MTFSLLLIALGASPAWTAEAQPSDQADSLAAQPITPNWRMLIDQSGRLTLEEVLTQRALFQRLEKRSYTAPASTSAVWLQVSLPAYAQPNWLWVFAPASSTWTTISCATASWNDMSKPVNCDRWSHGHCRRAPIFFPAQ